MPQPDDEERKSKSRRKREMLALQALGERLVGLSEQEAERLPLIEDLRAAVVAARAMQKGALKRQLRYIGGLLAREDAAAIERALAEADKPRIDAVRAFHEVEGWRDALVAGDDAPLDAVLARHPDCDGDALRRLVKAARGERASGRGSKAARALFRFLMALRPGPSA